MSEKENNYIEHINKIAEGADEFDGSIKAEKKHIVEGIFSHVDERRNRVIDGLIGGSMEIVFKRLSLILL